MPDKSDMSDSEIEQIPASDDEDMVNQELENLKKDSPSPPPQVSKQTTQDSLLNRLDIRISQSRTTEPTTCFAIKEFFKKMSRFLS